MRYRTIDEFRQFLHADGHILRAHPELFFQQAANQPDATAPARLARSRWETGAETRPWLRLRNRARRIDPCLLTISTAEAELVGCSFGPQGEWIRTVHRNGTMIARRLPSGTEWDRSTVEGGGEILAAAFAAGGSHFAAYSPGTGIRIYTDSGIAVMPGARTVPQFFPGAFAWSEAARRMVSGAANGELELWDATSGACLVRARVHQSDIFACAISRDGRWIASGSGIWNEAAWSAGVESVGGYDQGELCLWNTETDDMRAWRGHGNLITVCAFSPGADRVASGARDGSVLVWDAASGESFDLPGHPGGSVSVLVFSPDGTLLVSASNDRTVRVWDLASRAAVATLRGHGDEIVACDYSPDGRQLLSGARNGELKVWDCGLLDQAGDLEAEPGRAISCGFAPAAAEVLVATDGMTLDWRSAADGRLAARELLHGRATAAAFSPDGSRTLAAFRDLVELWNARTHGWLAAFTDSERLHRSPLEGLRAEGWPSWMSGTRVLERPGNHARTIAIGPDSARLVIGWEDGALHLWDLDGLTLLVKLTGHHGAITSCTFSPDGRHLLSAAADPEPLTWDVERGTTLRRLAGHRAPVVACCYSPDGRWIAATAEDGMLAVWAAETGRLAFRVPGGPLVAICPGSRRLVAGEDGSLVVRNLADGLEVTRFCMHRGRVTACAFMPDGLRIVSAAEDGSLRVWNAESAELVATWAAGSAIRTAAVEGATGTVAAGAAAGGIVLLDLVGIAPGLPVATPVRQYRAATATWAPRSRLRCPRCAALVLPGPACASCGLALRVAPTAADHRDPWPHRFGLPEIVLATALMTLGSLAGRWSPWLWLIGIPLILAGGYALAAVLLRILGVAVPGRCPRCGGAAILWREAAVFCAKCGRQEYRGVR
jgi:WD40 repeat protein